MPDAAPLAAFTSAVVRSRRFTGAHRGASLRPVRSWLWVVSLLAACGHGAEPPSVPISALEYRWGEGPWAQVATLAEEPPGRSGARELTVRFTLPAGDCIDPAINVTTCVFLESATIGARAGVATNCFIPVTAAEAGQQVELRFVSSQLMREGTVRLVCHDQMRQYRVDSDAGALWVACTLLIAGVVLGLLAARGGQGAAALATGGLFCLSVGCLILQQSHTGELVLPVPRAWLRAARDVAAFVYPGAFTAFVAFVLPGRTRPLFAMSGVMAAALVVALALDLFGSTSLRASARFGSLLTLPCILTALVHMVRRVKTEPAARTLLAGFAFTVLFALPDIMWGIVGTSVLRQNVGHWGLLTLLGSMALVVHDRFRATTAAMEQRLVDIERLNEELRFQVESRSRELRAALASMPPPTPRDAVSGETIGGRYRVEGLLGRGGMAQVYRVSRLLDGQPFALKLLSGEVTRVDAARFAREAELAARLRHPNLVPVVDIGLEANGPLFLVMELVEGASLDRLRDEFGGEAFAWSVLIDVTRGLAAVHQAGVVHRDLKPSNVLVAGGVARLADFGVARDDTVARGDDVDATVTRPGQRAELTRTGAIIGTPRYMAPEVVLGKGAGSASDLYSLGLMAFELFTGEYPLAEPPYVAILSERALVRVVPGDRLPAAARSLLERLLADAPSERPSAAVVLEALERARPK